MYEPYICMSKEDIGNRVSNRSGKPGKVREFVRGLGKVREIRDFLEKVGKVREGN